MKKLSRKNLDELAKVMPVLSETEQKAFVGGTVYCDLSGNYLGKVGVGDDLKFISQSDFNYYKDNNLEGMGVSLGGLNDAGLEGFIKNHFSFDNKIIRTSEQSELGAGLTENGNLKINTNHFAWNNYYDALSVLEHEAYHYQKRHYIFTGTADKIENELETYRYQMHTSTFDKTSKEFQQATFRYMSQYL